MTKRITTELEWTDLVLPYQTLRKIQEILDCIKRGTGSRSLFYGPPGTGKTLAAALLGKSSGLDVYRNDLSTIVSKYIGETEKNIDDIFNLAQYNNRILYFDQAEALFGMRTETSVSGNSNTTPENSYLLQKMEAFPGVVIFSTYLQSIIDEAFTRCFPSMIYFAMPDAPGRMRIWKQAFSENTRLEEKVDLSEIAATYELSGGSIINIVRYCCIMALKEGRTLILLRDILKGIQREFEKDGKPEKFTRM